jgi:23S rRNA (cytosine1962-C5)-methyltransferase
MTIWTVKNEAAYRVKLRHPWVYRDEIKKAAALPHPGAPVELQNEKGEVLARGYGNIESKLSFRALSWGTESGNPTSEESVIYKLLRAWTHKRELGFLSSLRICFGEGDQLPGLVVDFYEVGGQTPAQALAVQVLTAGMDSILRKAPDLFKNLIERAFDKGLCPFSWEKTALIFRNDVRVRELEGLRKEEPRFVQTVRDVNWSRAPVLLNSYDWTKKISLFCDLYQGQKTGLFLDQSHNISSVLRFLNLFKKSQTLKVLDLCSYVGHWSAQFADWGLKNEIDIEITQMDISAQALSFAKDNASKAKSVEVIEQDVLEDWSLSEKSFDVVIADPPAFVKSAKDLDRGLSAYIRLNSEAIKRVKVGGYLVACSCSGLVSKEAFDQAVAKSFIRAGRKGSLILRGGNAWDHTALLEFPEGQYLKMSLFRVD